MYEGAQDQRGVQVSAHFFSLVTSNIDYFILLIGINSFRGGGGW